MRYDDVAIPLGAAWSSPFVKWQGALAEISSLDLAVAVTRRALDERRIDPAAVEGVVLGWTVPQPEIFYGAPTVAARIGAEGITGPMISQACATSVSCLHAAAGAVAAGAGPQLVVTTDRTSNAPSLSYPAPSRPGGAPITEHWMMDNLAGDPWGGTTMLATAENVAAKCGATRSELDDVTVLRHEQYAGGLAEDRAFQRRYLVPIEIPARRGAPLVVESDDGVRPVDAVTAAKLAPAVPDGLHTYASQTHPADGCAGAVVTTVDRARELSAGEGVAALLSTGFARVDKAHMPEAPVPAARAALAAAGLDIADVHAICTHNPFAINDVYFAQQTGVALDTMNTYGSSLCFGHPQGPTGLRAVAELIETLRLRGGGIGLFTGCAAGDTAAAAVLAVDG
jgi:acetyl-CoA acetyltransferase